MRRTRLAMAALGVLLAAPAVLHFASNTAQASGYIVSWAIDGSIDCQGAGSDDCPTTLQ